MSKQQVYTVEEALLKMQNYCTYQERCHKEVRTKLEAMRMIPEAIDHIVVQLIRHDFLNESRFARTFVQGKFKIKKWGRYRLVSELRKKDISKVNIEHAISEIDSETYIEVFNALAEKKFESLKGSNVLKKKRQLADYLLYRGWEHHLVYDKVNELLS